MVAELHSTEASTHVHMLRKRYDLGENSVASVEREVSHLAWNVLYAIMM